MRLSKIHTLGIAFLLGVLVTYAALSRYTEGYQNISNPDMSKYVLKSSLPPCPTVPDLTNYMLKTECPPVPDMSQYVLKSSVPKQQPIIIDTSVDSKAKCGDCPPCPRPRCPQVKCPPPTVCPAAAPCPRAVCPQTTVKCRAEEADVSPVRPFLAPLSANGFGQA
jgi:hypothetical protein